MKKSLQRCAAIIAAMILAFSLCACGTKPVNDTDTGEVPEGELRYSYVDGTYYSYISYYGEDGFASAMSMTVKNGIISAIRYDRFDRDMDPLSGYSGEEWDEKVADFRQTVKNLSAHVMQYQNVTGLHSSSVYAPEFILLATRCILLAREGDTEPSAVDTEQRYSVSAQSDDGLITTHLEVSFFGEAVRSISFWQTDPGGLRLTDWADPSRIPEGSSVTYMQLVAFLNRTYADMTDLKKDDPFGLDLEEVDSYNACASKAEKLHRRFRFDQSEMLSSL